MNKSIVLIQPPLLILDMDVDVIQKGYWRALDKKMQEILKEKNLDIELNKYSFIEPNIGLFYVAASLKKSGYNLKYLDLHVQDVKVRGEMNRPISIDEVKSLINDVPRENMNIVAISALTINIGWAIKIAKAVKEKNKNCVVILGGVHASFEYITILKDEECVDIVSVGEGEETMVEVADSLYANGFRLSGLESIKGIAYRKDEKPIYTGERPFINDLDSLPYPLYDLLSREVTDNLLIRVITSRGCSNSCSFCVPSKLFNKLRFRDPVLVVNELEYYHKTYGWKTFMIGDLNFLSNYSYAKKFCEELMNRNLGLFWVCQSRVDLIDKDIVRLMHRAGCIMICLGIESAEQEILNNSKKGIELEKSIAACNTVKEANIKLYTYWVFGLPGETHNSAHATIKLLRKLLDEKLIDYTHCTVCVPFPGTDLYKNPSEHNIKIISDNFDDYWLCCDYLGAGLPVIETEELSSYEIYAYWQMALAVVAGNL